MENVKITARIGPQYRVTMNIHCEPCSFEKSQQPAIGFCVACVEYLCMKCCSDHQRIKATRSHSVLKDEHFPKDVTLFKRMKELMRCSTHTEIEVSYRCADHNMYICASCLSLQHRKCTSIQGLDDVNNNNPGTPARFNTGLFRDLMSRTVALKRKSENNMKELLNDKTAIEKECQLLANDVKLRIDLLEMEMEQRTKLLMFQGRMELLQDVNQCNSMEKELRAYKELFDITEEHGSRKELVIVSDHVKKHMRKVEIEFNKICNKLPVHLEFEKKLAPQDIASIGNVRKKPHNSTHNVDGARKSSDEVAKKILQKPTVHKKMVDKSVQVTAEKPPCSGFCEALTGKPSDKSFMKRPLNTVALSCCVQVDGDNEICSIVGSVILPDHSVLIIDRNNAKLKLLGNDFTMNSYFKLDPRPIDLCLVDSDPVEGSFKVAVCFLVVRKLIMYKIKGNEILAVKQFPTQLYVQSITPYRDLLAVLFSNKPKDEERNTKRDTVIVQLRDPDCGKICGTINEFDENGNRNILLQNPSVIRSREVRDRHTRVTPDVLIGEESVVRCFDFATAGDRFTNCGWFYRSHGKKMLRHVSDVTTDVEGNLYICAADSSNIHQVSAESYKVSRILNTSVCKPVSVSVDSERGCIVVGCEADDELHVFFFM